jgi:hypothetical protein
MVFSRFAKGMGDHLTNDHLVKSIGHSLHALKQPTCQKEKVVFVYFFWGDEDHDKTVLMVRLQPSECL